MDAEQLIQQGDFEGALRVLDADPRTTTEPERLLMVFNLRTRIEEYDGALAALEQLVRVAPDFAAGAGFLQDCAEAERTRTARRRDARAAGDRSLPVGTPSHVTLECIKAATLHAEGRHEEVAQLLTALEQSTPAVPGTLTRTNGAVLRFTHLTDSDGLTGPHLPCFVGRTLVEVPYADLKEVSFGAPRSSMDVVWLPAMLVPRQGSPWEARVFSLYSGTGRHEAAAVRLGNMTLWEHEHGYAEAMGQRDFKLTPEGRGTSVVGILQVKHLAFDSPPGKRKGFWSRLFG